MTNLTNKTLEKLKYDLVRDGLITYDDLQRAEDVYKTEQSNIGQILIKLNLIEEEVLLKFLEAKLHIPYVDLENYSLDEKCLSYISRENALKHVVIPLFKIENTLTVAMDDPLDLFVLNDIIKTANCEIEPIIGSQRNILKAIEENYENNETPKTVFDIEQNDWRKNLASQNHDKNHIKKLINSIIEQAFNEDVFEVYFEPFEKGLKVKFNKETGIEDKGDIPILLSSYFISILKNISNLDSTVCEHPQLSRFRIDINSKELNIMISTFPTIKGERVTLKLYKTPKKLEEWSISSEALKQVKNCCNKASLIGVFGDGLSGKTSFVYSLLSSLSTNKTIMTVESTVKYELKGVNQCELNENIGFSLNKAMKHVEFQSPDVVYFENVFTAEFFEYVEFLINSGKTVIIESSKNNFDLLQNLDISGCIVNISDNKVDAKMF